MSVECHIPNRKAVIRNLVYQFMLRRASCDKLVIAIINSDLNLQSRILSNGLTKTLLGRICVICANCTASRYVTRWNAYIFCMFTITFKSDPLFYLCDCVFEQKQNRFGFVKCNI